MIESLNTVNQKHNRKHSMSHTPTYVSWSKMMARCYDPQAAGYANYGGRGIKVCGRWHSFVNFWLDMGTRPVGTSIDRINSDGDYEPSNCRWATPAVQNSRRGKFEKKLRVCRVCGEELFSSYSVHHGCAKRPPSTFDCRRLLSMPGVDGAVETHSVTEWARVLGTSKYFVLKRYEECACD